MLIRIHGYHDGYERERERERAPDRETSATPRPANRRVGQEHSPCDWDPTAGGRDGMNRPVLSKFY